MRNKALLKDGAKISQRGTLGPKDAPMLSSIPNAFVRRWILLLLGLYCLSVPSKQKGHGLVTVYKVSKVIDLTFTGWRYLKERGSWFTNMESQLTRITQF